MSKGLNLHHFYHEPTGTLTYVLVKEGSALVIDPAVNFDLDSAQISLEPVQQIQEFISRKQLKLEGVLETHVHADHLSGAKHLLAETKAPLVISERIGEVQETFATMFELEDFRVLGGQFDQLCVDGSRFELGPFAIEGRSTPGHTPACMSYIVEDYVFVGDLLFQPDSGVGRCDFPSGSAKEMYQSVTEKIFSLPDETLVCTGHDYQPGGRPLEFQSLLKTQREKNVFLNETVSEEMFIEARERRDATLKEPRLLYPSLYYNIHGRAELLPAKPANAYWSQQISYL